MKKDIVYDLQPFLDADSDYDDDPVAPALLDLYRVDGKLSALPKDYVTHAVIYNKGVLDEAGVDYPEDGDSNDPAVFLRTLRSAVGG